MELSFSSEASERASVVLPTWRGPRSPTAGNRVKRSLITGLIVRSIIPCNYAMQRHVYKVYLRSQSHGVRATRVVQKARGQESFSLNSSEGKETLLDRRRT